MTNIGMDGIYSIQRPNALNDITSPDVTFHNLKQRMQDLVAERGIVDNITFDVKTRRYIFNEFDPMGNARTHALIESFPDAPNNFDSGDSPF